MAKSKFAGKLAKMQSAYEKAERPGGGVTTDLPDGKYRAQVTTAELSDSSSGDLKIKWVYTIEDGDHAGSEVTSFDNLGTEKNLGFLKSKLARFGYDPDSVDLAEELESILKEIVEGNAVVSIQVKSQTDSDFVNVYVNKLLDMAEPAAEEEEEPTANEGKKENVAKAGTRAAKAGVKVKEEEPAEEEAVEEEETAEEVVLEKGSEVMYKPKGAKKALEFVVLKVNADDTLLLKGEDGKKYDKVDAELVDLIVTEEAEEEEAVEEEAAEEEAVELTKGTKVKVTYGGKKHDGSVMSVDEDSETAKIKIPKLNKIVQVEFSEIDIVG